MGSQFIYPQFLVVIGIVDLKQIWNQNETLSENIVVYFILSIQTQSVIKSLNGKKAIRSYSSHISIRTPLFFDHFYWVSIQTVPQDPVWPENRFMNTAKCWQTFNGFLQNYYFYYKEKLRVDKLASFTLAYKSFAVFVC